MEKTIGMRIRECRKEIGMSQEELARRMNMKKQTISAYEHDQIDIKLGVIKELALVLATSVGYLVEGDSHETDVDVIQIMMLFEGMSPELRKVAIEQVKALKKLEQNGFSSVETKKCT